MAQIHFSVGVIQLDDADLPLIVGLTLRPRLRVEDDLRYVEFKLRGKTALLHRHLLGAGAGEFVDHINGDGFDNRRENLRLCIHTENMQNRRIHRNNRSGFKGVYFDVRRGTYRAQVQAFNRRYCLGPFDTAEVAYEAYVEKAKQLHGAYFRGGITAANHPGDCASDKAGT